MFVSRLELKKTKCDQSADVKNVVHKLKYWL